MVVYKKITFIKKVLASIRIGGKFSRAFVPLRASLSDWSFRNSGRIYREHATRTQHSTIRPDSKGESLLPGATIVFDMVDVHR